MVEEYLCKHSRRYRNNYDCKAKLRVCRPTNSTKIIVEASGEHTLVKDTEDHKPIKEILLDSPEKRIIEEEMRRTSPSTTKKIQARILVGFIPFIVCLSCKLYRMNAEVHQC